MSDKIEVGDRVRISVYGGFHDATVLALDADWAWVLQDHDRRGYTSVPLAKLTRIEPEKVVLTPKYAVGREVQFQGGIYSIEKVVVAYELTGWFGLRAEDSLEPAPEPCPKCKGSGKASE